MLHVHTQGLAAPFYFNLLFVVGVCLSIILVGFKGNVSAYSRQESLKIACLYKL